MSNKSQSCRCDICGRGIVHDTIVDNDEWARISPSGDEGGMLCASCMVDRLGYAAARIVDAHPTPAVEPSLRVTDEMVADARAAYSKATGCDDTPHVLDGWIEEALRAALEAAIAAQASEGGRDA